MFIKDFFNDSSWTTWGLIALYAAECMFVVFLVFKLFFRKTNKKFDK